MGEAALGPLPAHDGTAPGPVPTNAIESDVGAPHGDASRHSAHRLLEQFAVQQAAGRRHLVVLLGAGASRAAGIPDLAGLEAAVRVGLQADHSDLVDAVFSGGINLEAALTRLRRLALVLGPEDDLNGLTIERALAIERAITRTIIDTIVGAAVSPEVFDGFAVWAMRQDRSSPVEVFTLNYDLLIEMALEKANALYFDGFVGTIRARFHDYLVESLRSDDRSEPPASFVRLWKLHGSINWLKVAEGAGSEVVRLGAPVGVGETAAIYPSEEKYVASRRVPFLVLHDRLRRSLSEPETLLLIAGYSFGDDHLNEVIFDSLARRGRSVAFAFFHGAIPTAVASRAELLPNLIVAGANEAVIAGVSGSWVNEPDELGALEGDRFLLGDFAALSRYLAKSTTAANDGSD